MAQLQAQNKQVFGLVKDSEPTYSVSLLASRLKNPGLNFRYEYPIAIKQKTEPKRKIKALYLDGNLGFYWDPYTHVATYMTAGVLHRRTFKRNFQTTIGLNPLGIQRNFFHEAYEVNEQLDIEKKLFAGRFYYAPQLILGIGRLKKNKASFLNLHIMPLYKYNLGVIPNFSVEFGYRF